VEKTLKAKHVNTIKKLEIKIKNSVTCYFLKFDYGKGIFLMPSDFFGSEFSIPQHT